MMTSSFLVHIGDFSHQTTGFTFYRSTFWSQSVDIWPWSSQGVTTQAVIRKIFDSLFNLIHWLLSKDLFVHIYSLNLFTQLSCIANLYQLSARLYMAAGKLSCLLLLFVFICFGFIRCVLASSHFRLGFKLANSFFNFQLCIQSNLICQYEFNTISIFFYT